MSFSMTTIFAFCWTTLCEYVLRCWEDWPSSSSIPWWWCLRRRDFGRPKRNTFRRTTFFSWIWFMPIMVITTHEDEEAGERILTLKLRKRGGWIKERIMNRCPDREDREERTLNLNEWKEKILGMGAAITWVSFATGFKRHIVHPSPLLFNFLFFFHSMTCLPGIKNTRNMLLLLLRSLFSSSFTGNHYHLYSRPLKA